MKARYLAIEREYGSGGTRIGALVSSRTGVPCYGREILEAVSQRYDVSIDEIQRYEETATNGLLYTLRAMAQTSSTSPDLLSVEGHVYVAEQQAIRDFAQRGRGIFMGHCAANALSDAKGVVRVFIRCDSHEAKRTRIIEDYGIPVGKIEDTSRRYDRKRANYYAANTGRKWDDMHNYDLVLDSGSLGVDTCVDLLSSLLD
ncbi:MAG: cytidylate kinase-like family protein [Bifidobacteriaceae bacterium]|nr:cytidylate kinase-like family protein [Bifidobacteriaceae bacterium]